MTSPMTAVSGAVSTSTKVARRRLPRRMPSEPKRYRLAVTAFLESQRLWTALDDLATEGFVREQLSILTTRQARSQAAELGIGPNDLIPDHVRSFEADLDGSAIILMVSSDTDEQHSKASKVLLKHSRSRIKVCEFTRASQG